MRFNKNKKVEEPQNFTFAQFEEQLSKYFDLSGYVKFEKIGNVFHARWLYLKNAKTKGCLFTVEYDDNDKVWWVNTFKDTTLEGALNLSLAQNNT